ncbi:MAG: 30S ribosomal protein S17 [Phycisphaerae bacterium]
MTETVTDVKKEATSERGRRRIAEAVVISAKQDKTVRVEVKYLVKHPRYNKYLRERTRLQVHDEAKEAKVGDKVEITECRPISKTKKWRLVRVLEKAKV